MKQKMKKLVLVMTLLAVLVAGLAPTAAFAQDSLPDVQGNLVDSISHSRLLELKNPTKEINRGDLAEELRKLEEARQEQVERREADVLGLEARQAHLRNLEYWMNTIINIMGCSRSGYVC